MSWSVSVLGGPERRPLHGPASDHYRLPVMGSGDEVRSAAEGRGFDFLDDTRENNQPVAEFVYRNILPTAAFTTSDLYRGDYRPTGMLCTRSAFLAGACP